MAPSRKTCVFSNTNVRTLNLTQNVDILKECLVCLYVLYIWFIVASFFVLLYYMILHEPEFQCHNNKIENN
jgi:hypothetical protein